MVYSNCLKLTTNVKFSVSFEYCKSTYFTARKILGLHHYVFYFGTVCEGPFLTKNFTFNRKMHVTAIINVQRSQD